MLLEVEPWWGAVGLGAVASRQVPSFPLSPRPDMLEGRPRPWLQKAIKGCMRTFLLAFV